MNARVFGLGLAILVACVTSAQAHQVGLSRSSWTRDAVDSRTIHTDFQLARNEALALAPKADADGDGLLSEGELPGVRPTVDQLVAGLTVTQGDAPCVPKTQSVALVELDGLAAHVVFSCPTAVTDVRLEAAFLGTVSPGHRHLASTEAAVGPQVLSLEANRGALTFAPTPTDGSKPGDGTPAPGAPAFDLSGIFILGVEHILTGFDHLVFLLGLLVIGGRLKTLLGVITAFTVAHSLTLALAALDILTPPSELVEAAIAASIVYVGVENLVVKEPRHRWVLTFAFGLIHGFGFAGVLAELGLKSHLVPTLLGFNLGVEAGQLAVVAVGLPLLLWAGRAAWFRRHGVRAISAGVVAAGVFWLAERLGLLGG